MRIKAYLSKYYTQHKSLKDACRTKLTTCHFNVQWLAASDIQGGLVKNKGKSSPDWDKLFMWKYFLFPSWWRGHYNCWRQHFRPNCAKKITKMIRHRSLRLCGRGGAGSAIKTALCGILTEPNYPRFLQLNYHEINFNLRSKKHSAYQIIWSHC